MIELAYPPSIQRIIDRWHIELRIGAKLDESKLTKEHLRLLLVMLIEAVITDNQQPTTNNSRPDARPFDESSLRPTTDFFRDINT
ncbi:MAG: hypothetical protein HY961_09730 [Ignavibacteriae bacterium]|nr:hypothetical protein [Ignavibacteriota bacterium]